MVYNNNGGGRGDFKKKKKGGFSDNSKKFRKEEYTKEVTFKFKGPKETKQFKINLNVINTEKVDLPIFGDKSKHETMFILEKEFNLMVKDGDLMKENGRVNQREANHSTMTAAQRNTKLTCIQEVYRIYRSCLKRKTREKWTQVMTKAPIFEPAVDNYAPDNNYSVEGFKQRQKELAGKFFSDDIIEDVKGYLQDTMKPTYLSVKDYITRVDTINNYIPLMQPG
mmetsp:Transcript_19570/g.23979  ORF Transcript_19570/g.23979 Transcript_19570/m.23979 type:complete len:224 (+) Transcript_19570:65-736(+)